MIEIYVFKQKHAITTCLVLDIGCEFWKWNSSTHSSWKYISFRLWYYF